MAVRYDGEQHRYVRARAGGAARGSTRQHVAARSSTGHRSKLFIGDASDHGPEARPELQTTMKSCRAAVYDFIPSDDSLLEARGVLVVYQISKIYGPLNNNSLNRDNFIAEVSEVEKERP